MLIIINIDNILINIGSTYSHKCMLANTITDILEHSYAIPCITHLHANRELGITPIALQAIHGEIRKILPAINFPRTDNVTAEIIMLGDQLAIGIRQ